MGTSNTRGGLVVVLLLSGCVRSVADVPVAEGGFLTGTVVARDRTSGLVAPVVGARVAVIGASVSVTTDEDGAFRIARLPLGAYDLAIEVRARGAVPELARRVGGLRIVVDGQSLDLGDVRLGGLAEVEGRIALADRPEIGAAEGTTIVLVSSPFQGIVGRDDTYRLAGIPPGPYELAAYRPGYAPARIDAAEVGAGLRAALRSLTLEPADPDARYPVVGTVDVLDGEDEGVKVTLVAETSTAGVPVPATTDVEGAYDVRVPAGVYRGRFEKDGYRRAELRNVVVTADGVLGLRRVVLGRLVEGDFDGDGTPDADDADDDGDGCPDDIDAFPLDELRCFDADGDGIADEDDLDDDDDTLLDAEERSFGRDGWLTNPFDRNTDADCCDDAEDNCPLLPSTAPIPDVDQDGFGDLCVPPGGTTPVRTATITSVLPWTQARGLPITFVGENLGGAIGVEFTGGGFGRAQDGTTDAFDVIVPTTALDGPLTVYVAGGMQLVPSGDFTVLAGPVVEDFSPRRVSRGDTVTLSGTGLEGLTAVWIGGIAAPLAPGSATARTVVVPEAAPDGAVVVEYGGPGRTSVPGVLTVVGDPLLTQIVPNPAAPGSFVTLFGRGFVGSDAAAPIAITFDGVAVTPTSVSDTVLEAIVPNASSGPVIVSRSGRSSPPLALTIDAGAAVVSDVQPGILYEGDAMTILGANLHAPPGFVLQAVRVGGVAATVTSMASGAVDVVIPTDPASSTVEVDVSTPAGMQTTTFVRGPTILREVGRVSEPHCGVAAGGTIITRVSSSPVLLRTYDYPFQNPSAPFPASAPGLNCAQMVVAPNGRVAVSHSGASARIQAFVLPSMLPVGPECAQTIPSLSITFDSASRYGYLPYYDASVTGVLRISLETGACDVFGGLTGQTRDVAMLPGTDDRRLAVVGNNRTTAIVDAFDGSIYGQVGVGSNTVHVDPNGIDIWTDSLTELRTPGTVALLARALPPSRDLRSSAQSPNLRYIASTAGFHDLATRRHVVANFNNLYSYPHALRSPSGATAFLVTPVANESALIEVFRAPPM